MYKKLSNIAIISFIAIIIGIFSTNAFGQSVSEVKQKMDYYDSLAQQWAKYRNETVLPYYNDPTYYRWARSEYQKATQQISNAQKYKIYYQKQYEQIVRAKTVSPGTETVIQECWVRVRGGSCSMIYGQVLWYDDGNVNRSDYDNKRIQMTKAGYLFMWAKEYSRKRFGESKYKP
jgi:hypothetical protein